MSMSIGELVKVYGNDQHGRDVSGMSGHVVNLGAIYATVALVSWGGAEVIVPRFDCRVIDATPQTVAEWKAEHGTWKRRNARVIQRMEARRVAA